MNDIRVRVAPSPTGDPHVGTAYITLFNYVFAKKNGGKLILRLEDTDRERARDSSRGLILSSLKWLGLSWDEGPDVGGPHGPYVQSERTAKYREHADKLLESGHAYRCFCTPERLSQVREQQKKAGGTYGYDGHCRSLDPKVASDRAAQGESHVIRLRTPDTGEVSFEDVLRGTVSIPATQIDDQVLLKSDGFPTYHLANVVDDHLMRISHVIRAEEWISSTPKHVLLYAAFGWEAPEFVHMPLLRNTDKSKISKRKNPVSLEYYRRKGILPQAMVNFLGLMGWAFSETEEKFSLSEMIERFKPKDIHLGGPVFDIDKLVWLNSQYMQELTAEQFSTHIRDNIMTEDTLQALFPLFRERIACFEEFVDKTSFCFSGDLSYDATLLVPKGKTPADMASVFLKTAEAVDAMDAWDEDSVDAVLAKLKADLGLKPKEFLMPIRIAVTGRKDSPPLIASLVVVGREMVRHRLRQAANRLEASATSESP